MTAETLATIERLRAMGARRIRVGDVEVEFTTAVSTPSEPRERERTSPEEAQRKAREDAEALLFAASG